MRRCMLDYRPVRGMREEGRGTRFREEGRRRHSMGFSEGMREEGEKRVR